MRTIGMSTLTLPVMHRVTPLQRALLAGLLTLQAGCSLFGIRTSEEASYTVLTSDDSIELREYAPQVIAETRVEAGFDEAGEIAFRRLFGYISGDNVASREISMTAPVVADDLGAGQEIEMTAPVVQQQSGAGWRFAFVLPSSFTLATAPAPTSGDVNLVLEPRKTVAALRYRGGWDEDAFRRNVETLRAWMAAQKLEAASPPRAAGYDPPWTLPFLRRNEVLIDVAS